MTAHVLAVILAGGRGRRLGGVDKALVPLAGRPLIRHVIDRLTPQVDGIIVNANGDAARFHGLVVRSDDPSSRLDGPILGLATAFAAFAATAPATHLLTVPTDTPFLPHDLVRRLMAGTGEGSAAFATTAAGAQPVISLWTRHGAGAASARLRDYAGESLQKYLIDCNAAPVDFADASSFLNINSPTDLAQAARHL